MGIPFRKTRKNWRVANTRHFLLLLWSLTVSVVSSADNVLNISGHQDGGFPLFANGKPATVCLSAGEPLVVQKAAQLFTDDVQRVTGHAPQLSFRQNATKGAVVIATIGCNSYVDQLANRGIIDLSDIRGGWERFIIKVVDGRLFIIGSDRRGTAYGVFALSEAMGVFPWYWWADVPVSRREAVYVDADYVSRSPSVKYRGIFINDEDWGLKPWASSNYEKDLGDIGPKTYAKVCELLLRLKGNMLAPAMHSCTGAFYSHPESKAVADSFGIIITTSHCEPLLLNNAAKSEWDSNRDGEWNYKTNRETIYKKWDDRLSEASQYENIYTVAMRGVHDEGLRGSLPMEERVPLIEKVISEQRELLVKHKAYTPLSTRKGQGEGLIPQIFVPYKETMDIYENGLRVPDDITLVWVDDNYGYMKRVSNPEEQQRSGRAGIYYHLSYLGAPHDYLWLNTTSPVLMYEELKKAYDCGADRYWLLNVGDIKPLELGLQTFFDMAWDIDNDDEDSFTIEDAYTHQAKFLARIFGPSLYNSTSITVFQSILDDYYRLAWSRKPEFMGGEYQWDDKEHTGLKPTGFSFRYYDEAQRRLADYKRISDEVERLASLIDKDAAPSFFELLQFSVQGAYQMNRKFLMAQLNQELAAEGRYAEANWTARQMEEAYDSINALNRRYNKQLNGKWDGMMALSSSFTPTCQFYQKPEVKRFEGAGEKAVALSPLRGIQSQNHWTVDLNIFDQQGRTEGVRLIKGLGYDGQVLQFGDPVKVPLVTGGAISDSRRLRKGLESIEYNFHALSDSVDIVIYAVPFWPLYKGRHNRIVVSIDDSPEQVFENKFKEYDRTWKDQVMRNGIMCRLRFAVDNRREMNCLRIQADPGQMIQRIIVDCGGLKPSYLGPSL